MRILMKASIPVEKGNEVIRNGTLGPKIEAILGEQKPEAAYFVEDNGRRTAYVVVNIDEPSQIPGLAEPWFQAFNAHVELHPAMTAEDLGKAGPAIEAVVKNFS